MRARASFDNKDLFLTPGLFGTIERAGSPPYRGVLIPDEAIGTDQDRRIVWVVADDGTVSPRVVRPGPRIDGYRRDPRAGSRATRPSSSPACSASGREQRSRRKRRSCRRSAPNERRSRGGSNAMRFAHFFVDRPIFASVLSIVIVARRRASPIPTLPVAQYPEIAPPTIVVRATYPGAECRDRRRDRRDAARAGDQRRRGHALHVLLFDQRRLDVADHHVQARHRPRPGAGAGPEPRRDRRRRACRRRCAGSASPRARARPT